MQPASMLRVMRNLSLLAVVALSSACALRTHGDIPAALPSTQLSWESAPRDAAAVSAPAPAPAATTTLAVPKLLGGDGYTRLSLGMFDPAGDISGLDTGYYAQVAMGKDLMAFLAVDVSLGYANAEGAGDTELKLVPLFLNGRAQLPIVIFELYGGLGVGGLWADYDFGPNDDSEFVLAGTAFLGAEVGLGKLALGLEYRYIATEDTDRDFSIEGHCGLVTLTLPF
jgi:hypothetical protein